MPVSGHNSSAAAPDLPNDLMIAAIALTHDAILVTANTRKFARVEGLRWEDWEAASAGERPA